MRERGERKAWATDQHTNRLVELLMPQELEEITLRRIGWVLDEPSRRFLCTVIDREISLYRDDDES